jgi:hypothetical protein
MFYNPEEVLVHQILENLELSEKAVLLSCSNKLFGCMRYQWLNFHVTAADLKKPTFSKLLKKLNPLNS